MNSRASKYIHYVKNKEERDEEEANRQLVRVPKSDTSGEVDKPFFKAWRNIVVNNEIYNQFHIISEIRFKHTTFTVGSLQTFDKRQYITKLVLVNDKDKVLDLSNEQALPTPPPLPPGLIPVTVEHIDLRNYCTVGENDIPEGVKYMLTGKCFRNINIRHIPSSVVKISLSSNTRVVIPDDVTDQDFTRLSNLTFITIDMASLDLLEHIHKFPILTAVCINGSDGRQLVISEGIQSLIFGTTFNSTLPNTYPQSLKSLKIGTRFAKTFNVESLPPTLQELFITSYHNSVRKRLNQFGHLKMLESLQYRSGRPHEQLEGRDVSELLPNIQEIIINNQFRFENKNGILTLAESFKETLKSKNQESPQQEQQEEEN